MAGNSGPCVSCGKVTEYACADCKIDIRKTVYVCESPICRDKHESANCTRVSRERIPLVSYDVNSDYCPLCGARPRGFQIEETAQGTFHVFKGEELIDEFDTYGDAVDFCRSRF